MPQLPLTSRVWAQSQRGDMLTEAIIGLLLFAVAGIGVSHIASKTAVSQRDSKVQHQVINELRSLVANRASSDGLCDGSALSTTNFATTVTVYGCEEVTAAVNGTAVSGVRAPVVLSATIEGIGEVRVGGAIDEQQIVVDESQPGEGA